MSVFFMILCEEMQNFLLLLFLYVTCNVYMRLMASGCLVSKSVYSFSSTYYHRQICC